jgi:hypothetical protein
LSPLQGAKSRRTYITAIMNTPGLIRLVLAFSLLAGAAKGQNLLVNGSFENYGGTSANSDKGIALPGWTIGTEGGIDIVFSSDASGFRGPYWQAADGDVSLSLNWFTPDSISQNVGTQAGVTYQLSFEMAAEIFGGPALRTMDVLWDNVVVGSPSFVYSGQGPQNMGWTQFVYNVVGTGNDVLTFHSTTPDNYGPALDAVSLVAAVPEPGVVPFCFLAMLAWAKLAERLWRALLRHNTIKPC